MTTELVSLSHSHALTEWDKCQYSLAYSQALLGRGYSVSTLNWQGFFPFCLFSLSLSLPFSPQLAGVYAECKEHLGDLKEHLKQIAAPLKKEDQVGYCSCLRVCMFWCYTVSIATVSLCVYFANFCKLPPVSPRWWSTTAWRCGLSSLRPLPFASSRRRLPMTLRRCVTETAQMSGRLSRDVHCLIYLKSFLAQMPHKVYIIVKSGYGGYHCTSIF